MIPHPLPRSYGRRKARKLRDQSQRAYDDVLPLVELNPEALFPSQKVWLEIGFGGGEHMLAQLDQNPDISMIGCEPFLNGVAKFLTHLSPKDYGRVRVWHEDVRILLEKIPDGYFERAFILFPDPWPKKRHHFRRLISKPFMDELLPKLKSGARLYVASDDAPYVEQIQDVLYHHPVLTLLDGPPSPDPSTWGPRPEGWPPTRYEQKALKAGKVCAYMVFQRK